MVVSGHRIGQSAFKPVLRKRTLRRLFPAWRRVRLFHVCREYGGFEYNWLGGFHVPWHRPARVLRGLPRLAGKGAVGEGGQRCNTGPFWLFYREEMHRKTRPGPRMV